jgi:hypothetical protein
MQPDDSFQIVQFDSSASQFASQPLSATPENVERALNYLDICTAAAGR